MHNLGDLKGGILFLLRSSSERENVAHKLDPTYGRLIVERHYLSGSFGEPDFISESTEFELYECTADSPELQNISADVLSKMLGSKMSCIKDLDKVELIGVGGSPVLATLKVRLQACTPESLVEG